MPLILLSGRPGAGKTEFGEWLAAMHGFVHIDTDKQMAEWGRWLSVQDVNQAIATRNHARSLGPNVVIEWGFRVEYLDHVKLLRLAQFDTWWFDGDEAGLRQSYIQRRGSSPGVMMAYDSQLEAIQKAWTRLEPFYRGKVIRTVTAGPAYMACDEIASAMGILSRKIPGRNRGPIEDVTGDSGDGPV